jgi:hypothetical protein
METFLNVWCARCGLVHSGEIKAKTIGVAIKRATVSCSGLRQTREGIKPTVCATNFTAPVEME